MNYLPNKLEDLTVTKVAFVEEGDNKGAACLIFKRKPDPPPPESPDKENLIKRIVSAIEKALKPEEEPPKQKENAEGKEEKNDDKKAKETPPIQKGETLHMNIDKSKLTPEELAALDAMEKKAGIPEDNPPENTQKSMPSNTQTSDNAIQATPTPTKKAKPVSAENPEEDIYKGLHPAVKAELERLRKQADAIEERELTDLAKKYEIIGKKADELVPLFKSLKAAGGDAFQQMVTILDASVTAVEKSGLFSEIGKQGATGENDAWAAIEKHAEAIQKAAPTLTWNQAVDKACAQHPDLVHEYENGL